MALYYYHAFDRNGKKISGQIDAPSEQSVKENLVNKGLFPSQISLVKASQENSAWYSSLFERGVSVKDKMLFTKQLAVLLRSGIPLLHSLELLTDQFQGKMKSIIIHLKDGVKEGRSLTDGLKDYPKEFDKIYVQLVRAGEATGNLETILKRLNAYMERQEVIRKKIKDAMRNPLIQIAFILIIVVALLTFVVPKIAQTFKSQGASLPLSTRILMSISGFLINHYLILILILASLVALFKYWISTASGAYAFDQFKLKVPIFKYFVRTAAVVQFAKTLGMLLEGGVRLSEALDIVCDIVSNRVLATALEKARDNIIKEGKITQYLKQTNIFPPMAIYLIGTGEESGELANMLLSVGDSYEEELSELTDNLTAALNPIMIAVVTLIASSIIMAMVQPILNMNNVLIKR